jgi:cyclophilin family peptidyl-prolyl cis-trans isomerase
LDLFLALQRDLLGRFSWEPNLLPRPVLPEIAAFATGFESWAPVTRTNVPRWVAAANLPEDLPDLVDDPRLRPGADMIAAATTAAATTLMPEIERHGALRERAARELDEILDPDRYLPPLRAALGPAAAAPTLDLYLVPYAPHTPAAGFLSDRAGLTGMYVDCNRFRGTSLADSVLTMLGWAHLMAGGDDPRHLSVELATRLPGTTRYRRRLRVLLTKILVEMLSGHLVRAVRPAHRPCHDTLGTRWRYPRLSSVAERHWSRYLNGDLGRDEALAGMAGDLAAHSSRWFVDHIDPSSLAADFYLLEWLSAAGDREAGRRLARWLPHLCADLAGHLDQVIGNELGHFGRARAEFFEPPLAAFLRQVSVGDSRVEWRRLRSELGHARALDLATQAFAGPGVEFGGEAWRPIAAMMRRYVTGELPDRVFVDQCFTLEHNNGSVFDKFYDVESMPAVLDAQARTDLDTLVRHASAEVRQLWRRKQRRAAAAHDPAWFGPTAPVGPSAVEESDSFGLSLRHARPGALGCGNRCEPGDFDPAHDPFRTHPVRIRHMEARRPLPSSLTTYRTVDTTLHTTLGDIHLRLWPRDTPYTVDNFVGLATGRRPWRDPATGEPGTGGFYDGTVFHRRVPGLLIQGGDRLGTGAGSAGFRILEEIRPGPTFDRPFRLAMVNQAAPGSHSTGSQFFITVAPAPHLEGLYAGFGEVRPASRRVVLDIAESAEPVRICSVTVLSTPDDAS